jgi:anti-sigma factor RsiW
MTMSKGLNDEVLHAYVDGGLSSDERGAVEAHLALHPEAAARARAWQSQNEALHRLFDPVLAEPHTLKVKNESERHASNAPVFWRNLSGLAAALVAGVGIGFFAHDYWAPGNGSAPRASIARQALLAHAVFVPEVRHPVEVTAREEQHLLAWLSKRLDAPLKAPSLVQSGYQLLGGRLLPASVGATAVDKASPVAMFMYENAQGKRLSLMVRREVPNTDTAFRFAQEGKNAVFYWVDGPFGYALVGDVGKDELSTLARLVYQQLNP